MTSVGQRCCANGVYVRVVNVRRHVWQRKRWRPTGRRPSFFTLAERQRGQCGILIPSQRKQYQQRGASLAHCNFAVSDHPPARLASQFFLWDLKVIPHDDLSLLEGG